MISTVAIPKRQMPHAPTVSPVAWWELGEAWTSPPVTRADSTANGHDLDEAYDPVIQAPGVVGNCVQGAEDMESVLVAASHADLQISEDLTVCGWFKVHDGATEDYAVLFFKGAEYSVSYNASGAGFWLNGAGPVPNIDLPAVDTWFFVAMGPLGLSVNGSPFSIAGAVGNPSGSDFVLLDNSEFHSAVSADQVGVWQSALSLAEVRWLYNDGAGRAFADL